MRMSPLPVQGGWLVRNSISVQEERWLGGGGVPRGTCSATLQSEEPDTRLCERASGSWGPPSTSPAAPPTAWVLGLQPREACSWRAPSSLPWTVAKEASAAVLSDDKGRGVPTSVPAPHGAFIYLLLKSGNSYQRCHPMLTAVSLTLDVGQREGLGSQGSKKRFVSSPDCGMAQGWGRPTPWSG